LSCPSGEEKEGSKIMKVVNRIMKSRRIISIKALATDQLVDSPLKKTTHWQLHVQDNVNGADTVDVEDTTRRVCHGAAESGSGYHT
jgi:hypothetical protein